MAPPDPSSDGLPKISVVTVVYNGLAVLPRTVDSVAEQDYGNIEYVVIDGASKDGTADWLATRRASIDVLVSEPDRGIYDAMNKGARLASGDYVYFLNAGDTFCGPQVLSQAARLLQDRPALLVGRVIVDGANTRYPLPVAAEQQQNARAVFDSHFCHQALFASRAAVLRAGGFDTRYPRFADFHNAWQVMQYGAVTQAAQLDVAHFSLDGVSSNWQKAVDLYREKERLLSALGCGRGLLAWTLGLWRSRLYMLKMQARSHLSLSAP